jgi:hypothetical protein
MKIIHQLTDNSISALIVRILSIASMLYLITVFKENPTVIAIFIGIILLIFISVGKRSLILTDECIILKSERIINHFIRKEVIQLENLSSVSYFQNYTDPKPFFPNYGLPGGSWWYYKEYMILTFKDGQERIINKINTKSEFLYFINSINKQIK